MRPYTTFGYTSDGGVGLLINAADGVNLSQGMVQTHGSVWGRTVHAGNLGGSTTAYVSAYLRPFSGQGGLKLTDNVADQQGWEAEVTFFGDGQGGNSNRWETGLKNNNAFQGGTSSNPGDIVFQGLGWIQAEIGFDGTTLAGRWRDVDDPSDANAANPLYTAWQNFGFAPGTPANTVFEWGGIRLAPGGSRADELAIRTTPLPEPASLTLLAIGGLTMLRRRR